MRYIRMVWYMTLAMTLALGGSMNDYREKAFFTEPYIFSSCFLPIKINLQLEELRSKTNWEY